MVLPKKAAPPSRSGHKGLLFTAPYPPFANVNQQVKIFIT